MLSLNHNGLVFGKFAGFLFRERQRQNAVLKFRLDFLRRQIIAHIEAPLHSARIPLLTDHSAALILLLFVQVFGSTDGQIAVLQLEIDLLLLESGQVYRHFVIAADFLYVNAI